ncbi:MAG: outer membrane lipid asymmetry maintenance protein MlaD [Acidocella sp. 20-61-6]|nr:MAG: outer membrane lipid asymmetry maintenance protein MlaD [Acidocella sp. 20-61-6]
MSARRLPELLTGLAVIVIAVGFLIYALGRANAVSAGGYPLKAQFSSIGSLAVGSDVKIGGVTIGHVAEEHLDGTTYAAIVKLDIDSDVKIPQDSSAAISSSGLLGGDYVAVSPGGSSKMLAAGQAFPVTQSAINLEDLLGKFIFSMGGSGSSSSGGANSGSGGAANASGSSGAAGGKTGAGIGDPAALPSAPQK